MVKVANHSSVFANRMIHHWTDQIIIGPYVIDARRNIRVIESLLHVRIGAMAEHLHTPETHVPMPEQSFGQTLIEQSWPMKPG